LGTEFGLAIVKLSLQPQIQTVKKTSWFLVLILSAFSCLDDPDCYLLNNDVIGISFGVMGSSATDSVRFNSLSVNGRLLWSNPEDDTAVSYMAIPADRFQNSLHIEMVSGSDVKTIDLKYSVKAQFVSEECGPRYIFSDLDLINHNFARLDIVNITPGRDASALNVRIYRCPKADTIGLSFFQLTLPKTGAASSRAISVKLDSITVDGLTNFYQNRTVSSVELPVNIQSTQTSYSFSFADNFANGENIRGLSVNYDVVSEARFEACGVQSFVENLELGNAVGTPFDYATIFIDNDGDTSNVATDPATNNINIYRCPPTNIVQLAFLNETGLARSKKIISISTDYSAEIIYNDTTLSRVQLPLNTAANRTTFTIVLEDVTEAITLDYTWSLPSKDVYPEGSTCGSNNIVKDLSEGVDNINVTVIETAVLYPAVTNVNLEVAD
jgi:hypothetical protein